MMGWSDADSFSDIRQLQREMNRLFEGAWRSEETYPAVDAWANGEEVVVKAEVPGVNPEDIDVTVKDRTLTIQGERKPYSMADDVVCHRAERETGQFVRSFSLPFEVESDRVSAQCRQGVLTVTLPRAEASKPRQIAVQAE
jgi:HSP20 family protein